MLPNVSGYDFGAMMIPARAVGWIFILSFSYQERKWASFWGTYPIKGSRLLYFWRCATVSFAQKLSYGFSSASPKKSK
jgi:hypothetical protein